MTLRVLAASAACIGSLVLAIIGGAWADGMPEPEDENFNPVPSKPGVPAPGMVQPPPIKDTTPPKPAPAPAPVKQPVPTPAPAVQPAPAPAPAVVPTPAAQPTPPAPPPTTTPAAAPVPAPQPAPATIAGTKPVYDVVSVEVQLLERNPPLVNVIVKGTTRTGGWKNIQLQPLQTFAPEGSMRTFTLVGMPPSGPATQSLTPVSAIIQINPLPDGVKTIRVLSETNEAAQTFR